MGQIITFYSYKGGVGRTFALANIAAQLSMWGYKILIVDWDLEAPGLHHYFADFITPKIKSGSLCDRPGLIEYFTAWEKDASTSWTDYRQMARISPGLPEIHLIFAGKQTEEDYGSRARGIPWDKLDREQNLPAHLDKLGQEWRDAYDFIFIDSRTGLSDTAGICTVQMPDILALVFTASHQSLAGTRYVAERSRNVRAEFPYSRGLPYQFPILSRFDEKEETDLARFWRGAVAEGLRGLYAPWRPKEISVERLVNVLKLPHITRWTFGEELAVLKEAGNRPELPAENTELVSYHVQTLAAALAHGLSDVRSLVEERSAYVKRAAQRAIARSGEKTSDEALAELVEIQKRAEEADVRGDRTESVNHYTSLLMKAESSFGADSPPAMAALRKLAFANSRIGNLSEAERLLRQLLASVERRTGTDSLEIEEAVLPLANLLSGQARYAEAETLLSRIVAIHRHRQSKPSVSFVTALIHLGNLLHSRGDLDAALLNLEEGEAISREVFGNDHPNVASFINSRGSLLQDQGRLEEALKCYTEAEQIFRKAFGDDHQAVGSTVNNRGRVMQDKGDQEGALSCFQEAERIFRKLYGDDHPEVAVAIGNRGTVLQDKNYFDQALVLFEEAERIDRKAYGDDHPRVATDVNNRGALLMRSGNKEGALRCFEEAERIDRKVFGDDHPAVATDVNNRGSVLQEMGDMEGARACAKEAFAIHLRKLGPQARDTLNGARNLKAVDIDPIAVAAEVAGRKVAAELERALTLLAQASGEAGAAKTA